MEKSLWLKDIRLKLDLTQEQVAERAGISRTFYTEIETGSKKPSTKTAKKIAQVLNFDWVIFFEDECRETQQTLFDLKF